MQALSGFLNAWKIGDLRKKILFTLFILIIYRLGGHITTPGIDTGRLADYFASNNNNLFGLYDAFTGGAFQRATIFALGIMPYISASIIIQLMGAVVPSIKQLQQEGAEGRAKITQWTRYGTIVLAGVQAWGISVWLSTVTINTAVGTGLPLLLDSFSSPEGVWGFRLLTTLTMTTGTMFIMYLGEQITSRGVGNGISLIIFIGIISTLPQAVFTEWEQFANNNSPIAVEFLILAMVIGIVAFIVFVEQGQRRIPLQSPKKVVGRKVMGGQSSYLPFKVNSAGVIPVIFASSLMFIPTMFAAWIPNISWAQTFANAFLPGHYVYSIVFALLIIFFTYFYTALQYNPREIAENLKKSGGYIPGVRPGRKTAEFLDRILTRITLPGAIFLALISVGPLHLKDALNMTFYIGGTSVLIVVGVALDTLRQLESQLHTKNYDGFLKKGRLRGRNSR
ncbi:MAG: preprotein translocase subunit SecY [Fibrobacterales bacterium]